MALILTLLSICRTGVTHAQVTLSESQAHAIGVQAYLYLYSLVTMDVTRRQLTNVDRPDGVHGPANTFANVSTYPTAEMKVVVRPNFDTLYSSAWLDLTKEPMIVSAPDTHGRYYMLPMLDMWTDVFASPGWRTTGTKAHSWAVVPPGWKGTLPADVDRIDAPTPYVWIIGRTKTDGPSDYDAVHKIQAGYLITPLSAWHHTTAPITGAANPSVDTGKPPKFFAYAEEAFGPRLRHPTDVSGSRTPEEPITGLVDRSVDMKTPPKVQVDSMSAGKFFAYAAEIMKLQPPHVTDQPIVALMRQVGFEPGNSFDLDKAAAAVRRAFETVAKDAQHLMAWKLPSLARVVNYWSMNTDTMGVYGNYYLKRAIVAQIGLGANLPEDAIYPLNIGDQAGKPLDGAKRYVLHFAHDGLPPTDGFWSVTLYDSEGYQVANSLNRFAVSSWMPFHFNPDGSLDLYFQNESPGADKEANWLPSPKGPFNLVMRLYAPRSEALTGEWKPAPVVRQ